MSTERLRGTCFSLSGERSSPSGYDPVRIVEETGGKGTELSVEVPTRSPARGRAWSIEPMNTERRFSVMVVEDHPIMRMGIASIIAAQPDMTVCCQAETGEAAVEGFR